MGGRAHVAPSVRAATRGQIGDGVVVEVVGADLDRHRPLGEEVAHPAGRRVEGRGRVALRGPALAEDGVGGLGRRAAQRHAEQKRSRTKVGMMSLEGFWVAAITIIPAARPLEIRSRSVSVSSVRSSLVAAAHVEGELVDGDDVEAEVAVPLDLAQARGEQHRVAPVHLGAEVLEHLDGAAHVGADEVLGRARPRGELDLLAVHEGEVHRGVERGGGDEEREGGRLAGPGLTAEEQVALGQPDRDRVPVLVDPEGRAAPTATPAAPGHGGSGDRERVAPDDREVGQRGVGRRRGRPGPRGPRWWRPASRPPPRRTRR